MAVAADVTLRLGPGLNVLTGSTGAGKSLVVEALRWLRGEKVDPQLVRRGAERASAEALFDVEDHAELAALLDELGLEAPVDGMLRLRREVRAQGRSRAYVGGQLSSAAVLEALCTGLVELQSQHQQLVLLDPRRHVQLLDRCGVPRERVVAWRDAVDGWRELEREREDFRRRQARLREERELLEYQYRELDAARLREGEAEELRGVVARLSGGARTMEAAAAARDALADDEGGALARVREAIAALRPAPGGIGEVEEARELLEEASGTAQEALRALERFLDGGDFEPGALDDAQSRLAEIEGLCRKYHRTEAELLALRDRLARDLELLGGGDDLPRELAGRLDAAREALQGAGEELHRERRAVARRIARDAGELLSDLGMAGAELRFELSPDRDPEGPLRIGGKPVRLHADGPARVRLRARTNPGEDEGPVEAAASGGELSRIGLVLRTLALRDRLPDLVILDEVDAGLGADLGPAVARRLRAMSASTQLLVITHLPAVAAAADTHLAASKGSDGERTVSEVLALDEEQRVAELARMLGGERPQARRLAQQLRAGQDDRREQRGEG